VKNIQKEGYGLPTRRSLTKYPNRNAFLVNESELCGCQTAHTGCLRENRHSHVAGIVMYCGQQIHWKDALFSLKVLGGS